jgi:hypothetical protein
MKYVVIVYGVSMFDSEDELVAGRYATLLKESGWKGVSIKEETL